MTPKLNGIDHVHIYVANWGEAGVRQKTGMKLYWALNVLKPLWPGRSKMVP